MGHSHRTQKAAKKPRFNLAARRFSVARVSGDDDGESEKIQIQKNQIEIIILKGFNSIIAISYRGNFIAFIIQKKYMWF